MNEELKQEIEKVDSSYQKRKAQEDDIWLGFISQVSKLTGIVFNEFNKVLSEIDLSVKGNEVKINDFYVKYNAESKDFSIKIREWYVDIDGEHHSDKECNYRYCAHNYLRPIIGFGERLNPKITKFQEDFNIIHIGYNCGCGSDHK